jgi:hypothetical protein
MRKIPLLFSTMSILVLMMSGCRPSPSLTVTSVSPTATPPLPTSTPTNTPLPPTKTPTVTPIPPTPTVTPVLPTPTPLPPTATVCAAGCDFTTIQAAIDAADATNGAIIEVTDPIHTEAGIAVNKDVTIRGLGADNTIVQAHETPDEAPERVFLVEEGATVIFERMTIRHGSPSLQDEGGGGVMNYGTLTLKNCVVGDNIANDGAGIYNNGTLTLVNSTVRDNFADGIAPPGYECGSGGGIKSAKGTLMLINSTVSGNEAEGKGGGVHISCACAAVFTNTTISGNKAASSGGGAFIKGTLQLVNCTISKNGTSEKGGGVFVGTGGRLDYVNTIIANNVGGRNCVLGGVGDYRGEGVIGVNSNNLVGDNTCSADHSGDPMLGPLADNGGDTLTHALLPGSPAIDAVTAISCTLPTDQRGALRPVTQESFTTPCDIGAFELQ